MVVGLPLGQERLLEWPFLMSFQFSSGTLPGLFLHLGGTLSLRCCAPRCASRIPTWRLPPAGRAADLVTSGCEEVGIVRVELCVQDRVGRSNGAFCLHDGIGVDWFSGPGGGL